MPRERKRAADREAAILISPAEKVARLLAILVTKDMGTDEAALKLNVVGFSAQEVATLLGVNANYVNAAKHRKKTRKKKIQK